MNELKYTLQRGPISKGGIGQMVEIGNGVIVGGGCWVFRRYDIPPRPIHDRPQTQAPPTCLAVFVYPSPSTNVILHVDDPFSDTKLTQVCSTFL